VRGEVDPQGHRLSYVSPESRVPPDHPLRAIKLYADQALASLDHILTTVYSDVGRPLDPAGAAFEVTTGKGVVRPESRFQTTKAPRTTQRSPITA
jgi:hypothetical protein